MPDFHLSRLESTPCQGIVGTVEYMDKDAHDANQTFKSDLVALGLALGRLRGLTFPWLTDEISELSFDESIDAVRQIKEDMNWDWIEWVS